LYKWPDDQIEAGLPYQKLDPGGGFMIAHGQGASRIAWHATSTIQQIRASPGPGDSAGDRI
jgi:hypothetical protein